MPVTLAKYIFRQEAARKSETAAVVPSYLRVLEKLTDQARTPFMFYQALRDVMNDAIAVFPDDVDTDIVFPKPYRAVITHHCSLTPDDIEFALARALGLTFHRTSSGVCTRTHQLDSAEYMVTVVPDDSGSRVTFVFNKA